MATPRTKTGGRKANTPNKINAETKTVIQNLVNDEVQKLPQLLDSLKPKDRAEILVKLISFVVPKQSKVELEAEVKERFTPVIILKITNGEGGKIENSNKTLAEMIRIINDIRATPESFIAGFVVQYKKPSII